MIYPYIFLGERSSPDSCMRAFDGIPCHARAKEEFAEVFTLDALPGIHGEPTKIRWKNSGAFSKKSYPPLQKGGFHCRVPCKKLPSIFWMVTLRIHNLKNHLFFGSIATIATPKKIELQTSHIVIHCFSYTFWGGSWCISHYFKIFPQTKTYFRIVSTYPFIIPDISHQPNLKTSGFGTLPNDKPTII